MRDAGMLLGILIDGNSDDETHRFEEVYCRQDYGTFELAGR